MDPDEAAETALQTSGGDITHGVYRAISRENKERGRTQTARHEQTDHFGVDHLRETIKMPGGMRRAHLSKRTTRHQMSDILMRYAGENLEEEDSDYISETTPLTTQLSADKLTTDYQAFFTMLKSIVGSGVLFLPRAFADGGSLFSCVFQLLTAAVTANCILLLLSARDEAGALSFAELGERALGRNGRIAVQMSLILFQFGLVVSYFIFVTDTLIALVADFSNCSLQLDPTVVIYINALLQLPISFLRNLRSLALAATIADLCIVSGLVLVVCSCLQVISIHGIQRVDAFKPNTAPLFIGTSVLSYEGVACMIPIKECMQHPDHFKSVLTTATIVVCFVYVLVGLLGLLAFGDTVEQNVLISIGAHGAVSHMVSFLYIIAILCSLPLQAFPAYRVIEKILQIPSGKHNDTAKWTKNVLRSFILMSLAGFATATRSYLHYIVAIIGGLAGVPMGFVLPALIHNGIIGSSPKADMVIAYCGVVMSVLVTAITAFNWITAPDVPTLPCVPSL